MHIHRTFWFNFFWEQCPFLNFKIWRKWKILLKHLVSTTPLKPLNRIAWNFVVMKDIMCRYAFLQEMLIWSFWGAIYIPFFVRLPVTNAWNCHSLYTAFSSNVGACGMWACSLFLSFLTVVEPLTNSYGTPCCCCCCAINAHEIKAHKLFIYLEIL